MPLEIPVKGQDHWYRYIFSRDTSNYNDELIFFFGEGGLSDLFWFRFKSRCLRLRRKINGDYKHILVSFI